MALPKNPSDIRISQSGKKVKRNVQQATYISLLLTLNKKNQKQIAIETKVNPVSVNQVIWGIRTSKKIQSYIAKVVGFSSWDQMLTKQTQAEQLFKAMKRGA